MAFQAVPGCALATIRGTLAGEQVANTLGFIKTTPGTVTAAELGVLGAGLQASWEGGMIPTMVAEYVAVDIQLRALDVENGPVSEESWGGGLAGALAGAILPNNCSFVISFRTGLGGATNRGRNYVNGLLESEVTGNNLSLTRINALRTAYAGMLGEDNVAVGWRWCVISRKLIAPSPDGRGVPITSVHITDARIDSQRRRLPRS